MFVYLKKNDVLLKVQGDIKTLKDLSDQEVQNYFYQNNPQYLKLSTINKSQELFVFDKQWLSYKKGTIKRYEDKNQNS